MLPTYYNEAHIGPHTVFVYGPDDKLYVALGAKPGQDVRVGANLREFDNAWLPTDKVIQTEKPLTPVKPPENWLVKEISGEKFFYHKPNQPLADGVIVVCTQLEDDGPLSAPVYMSRVFKQTRMGAGHENLVVYQKVTPHGVTQDNFFTFERKREVTGSLTIWSHHLTGQRS